MLRSALLILSGNATASLLLLARNLIVARMIPVADYGVASTFAVAMAVVEMASALGLQQQIVQSKQGDDPHFQAALQGFQLLRGVISAVVLFAIAGPMARFMGIPEVIWAYQLLALVPVLNALVHFDIHRLNRQRVFWPMLLTGALPALASVLALWPLAQWFGDWRVMLYAIVVQAVLGAAVSHLVATRPYKLAFDPAIIKQSLRFGWPLLANGVLLFLVFNAEKLILGRTLGMETLAIFSMGLTLTLTPTLVLAKSVTNFFLPPLSSATTKARFEDIAIVVFQIHILFAGVFVLGAATLGPWLITGLLGAKYTPLISLLVWLAILQALRIFKGGPSTVALARGQTENAMVANVIRIALLPVAWWAVSRMGDLMPLIYLGILGEFLGAVVAFGLVWWRLGIGLARFGSMLCCVLATMGLVGWNQFFPHLFLPLWVALVALFPAVWFSKELRHFFIKTRRY